MEVTPKHKPGETVTVTPMGVSERGRLWALKDGELFLIEGGRLGTPTNVLILGYSVHRGRVVYYCRAV
ncbi:MAG: hypothetical protein QXT28_12000 [Thermofilaceae archaeon]